MSLINEGAIEAFSKWAREHADSHIFPKISEEESSYYCNRTSEDTYLMEYNIETVQGLKEMLQKYSGLEQDLELLKMLTVEICQNRFRSRLELPPYEWRKNKLPENGTQEKESVLPEFIYVF